MDFNKNYFYMGEGDEDTPGENGTNAGGAGSTGGAGDGAGGTGGDGGTGGAGGAGDGAGASPYAKFKGGTYGDMINYLQGMMDDEAKDLETPEQSKKRERRERQQKFLGGLTDVLGAMHRSYAYSRGVKPMEIPTVSGKLRERIEKEKADRDRKKERYLNYGLMIGNLKDKDRQFDFNVTQAEQSQHNWRAMFDAGRADRREDVAWRESEAQRNQANLDRQFDFEKERDKRNFDESVRQFNRQISLQYTRMQRELESGSQTFTLGDGAGSVTVPAKAINSINFSAIYNSMPKKFKTAQGDPIYTDDGYGGRRITGYTQPTAERMAVCIGAYLSSGADDEDKENVRNQLRALGTSSGGNSGGKGRLY